MRFTPETRKANIIKYCVVQNNLLGDVLPSSEARYDALDSGDANNCKVNFAKTVI